MLWGRRRSWVYVISWVCVCRSRMRSGDSYDIIFDWNVPLRETHVGSETCFFKHVHLKNNVSLSKQILSEIDTITAGKGIFRSLERNRIFIYQKFRTLGRTIRNPAKMRRSSQPPTCRSWVVNRFWHLPGSLQIVSKYVIPASSRSDFLSSSFKTTSNFSSKYPYAKKIETACFLSLHYGLKFEL